MQFNIKGRNVATKKFKDLLPGQYFTLGAFLVNPPGNGFRRAWMKISSGQGSRFGIPVDGNCVVTYSVHKPEEIGHADMVLPESDCFVIDGELTLWME